MCRFWLTRYGATARLSQRAAYSLHEQWRPIGLISVTRKEPGPFAAHHVQLLQTFADQAVIAIENVRLFDEVQAKTRDLQESLQQQTATADVLKVISRSAFDLRHRLADPRRIRGPTVQRAAGRHPTCARATNSVQGEGAWSAIPANRCSGCATLRERQNAELIVAAPRCCRATSSTSDDALTDPEFNLGGMDRSKLGFRGLLGVPLLRKGTVEGAFVVSSPEPGTVFPTVRSS